MAAIKRDAALKLVFSDMVKVMKVPCDDLRGSDSVYRMLPQGDVIMFALKKMPGKKRKG